MKVNWISFSPISQITLSSIALILHIIAMSVKQWSHFTAKTELGLPEEVGHYGLWGLCSVKAPLYRDDCDPLDTFFRPPHYMMSAAVMASLHAIVSGLFLPIAAIRLKQITKNKPNFIVKTSMIVAIKVWLIIIAVLLVSLTLVLTTVREGTSREQKIFHNSVVDNYWLRKGWAFWLEVAVLCIDLCIVVLCLIEQRKLRFLDELGFTAFIANPNSYSLSPFSTSEYLNSCFETTERLSADKNPILTISNRSNDL